MAKRKVTTQNETNEPTALIVKREDFKEEISKRIPIGEEIYGRQIQTNEQFDQAKQ